MTTDISEQFLWQGNSWDTERAIIYLNDGVTPRLTYMLYDNPTDWETFKNFAETYVDISSNEEENLLDYQSYSLRITCDVRAFDSEPYVEGDVAVPVSGSACCIMDQSAQLGGGYCVAYEETYILDDLGNETDVLDYVSYSTYFMTNNQLILAQTDAFSIDAEYRVSIEPNEAGVIENYIGFE